MNVLSNCMYVNIYKCVIQNEDNVQNGIASGGLVFNGN